MTLSDQVREVAVREYVEPARKKGCNVEIPIGQMQQKLRLEGFPTGHIRQICTSLETNIFTEQNRLIRETADGQPERVSTVLRYRFADTPSYVHLPNRKIEDDPLLALAGRLRGAFSEGADAFIREMRKDKGSDL